ncbi:MAG: cation:proton antiporter [Vicinamibacterales bacterium]
MASTVVLLRALMDYGALDTIHGRVAVGWLVFEDIATVVILVLLPLLVGVRAGSDAGGTTVLLAVGKAAAFVALMMLVGARAVPWLLLRVVRLRSHEMFVLVALTIALGTALASAKWFGVSLALGAFIAGIVVSGSPYSHQVNADLLPFRDTFAVLFFVSVGMLVNPGYLIDHWREVLALTALIIVGKGLIGAGIGLVFPYPARTGLIVGAGLSQIGEFSFIVGQAGMGLGLLDQTQDPLILAGAIVSITLNPFMFRLIEPLEALFRRSPLLWTWLNRDGHLAPAPVDETMQNHVVIVGVGTCRPPSRGYPRDARRAEARDRLGLEPDSSSCRATPCRRSTATPRTPRSSSMPRSSAPVRSSSRYPTKRSPRSSSPRHAASSATPAVRRRSRSSRGRARTTARAISWRSERRRWCGRSSKPGCRPCARRSWRSGIRHAASKPLPTRSAAARSPVRMSTTRWRWCES